MSSDDSLKPSKAPKGSLKRPLYTTGNYLAHQDLSAEQRYLIQRSRRHLRYLHCWGVICGLRVVAANEPFRPWAVCVCPGYAIGPYADEIEVPSSVGVDIRDYQWTQPIVGGQPAGMAYVAIRHAERFTRPIPVKAPTCNCEEEIYKPKRIRDGFQIDILWELPNASEPPAFDLCTQDLAPCPDCPESPYVILAGVTLPASEGDPITSEDIDNLTFRRVS